MNLFNKKKELPIEMLLSQLRTYLCELNSFKSSYISTEAEKGTEYAFIYQMSICIRQIIEEKTNSYNDAILFSTDIPEKGVEVGKFSRFIKNEIAFLSENRNELDAAQLKDFSDEFVLRAKHQIGFAG